MCLFQLTVVAEVVNVVVGMVVGVEVEDWCLSLTLNDGCWWGGRPHFINARNKFSGLQAEKYHPVESISKVINHTGPELTRE